MEHQVKAYKRRTKSGKIITVRAHTRKGKDQGVKPSYGRGDEFSRIRDKALQRKIREYVAEGSEDYGYATDKDGLMSWKDTLKTLRHPNEAGVRSGVSKRFGIKLNSDKETNRVNARRKAAYKGVARKSLKENMSRVEKAKASKWPKGAYSLILGPDEN